MIGWARDAVRMVEKLHLTNPGFYNVSATSAPA